MPRLPDFNPSLLYPYPVCLEKNQIAFFGRFLYNKRNKKQAKELTLLNIQKINAAETAGMMPQYSKRASTIGVYLAFMLIGMSFTIYGPTIPFLMEDYRISLGQAGLFMTFMAMGRLLSVAFSGVLSDRLGRKALLLTGTGLLTAGLIAVGTLSIYWLAMGFVILAGVGHGMVDTSGSAAILDMHKDDSLRALNLSHMFFGVGCLIGPLISGMLLTLLPSWRTDYYVKGFAGILIFLMIAGCKFAATDGRTNNRQESGPPLFSWVLLLLGLVMFLYSGVGHTLNTWINKYMGDVVHFPVFFAAGSLAVYNLGLTAGRFTCGLIGDRVRLKRLIFITSVCSLAAISVALFSSSGGVIVVSLGLTGFFFGGLFPAAISIAGRMLPDRRGTVTGLLIMMAALGSMTIPAVSGFVSQGFGLQRSMQTLPLLVLVLVAVAAALQRRALWPPQD